MKTRPIVNEIRQRNNFYKSHSPIRRPFNKSTAPKANFTNHKVNTAGDKTVSAVRGYRETAVKASAGCNWRPKRHYWNKVSKYNSGSNSNKNDDPQKALKNKGIVDSGCSRHMTGNKAYLVEYQDYNGGPVAFGGSKGYISDTECLVFSPDFKLPDENQVLLRVPRQNNMYSFNLENIVPSGGLACLIAKATVDKSNKWHRRLGHVNFKNLNKLMKGNLVRGLPSKIFQNDHTCVACQKGKQHKASCKAKLVSSISQPLQLLHMDLFGPTSDETSGILKDFIRQIENQLNQKVKTIRCDNGTEFKNRDIIEFCGSKGIKREYSNARTPQQNGVAERKNMTLIEAARTMLADSFLPNTFWAEAVSTACYVLNRVLVTKPQNKTPYELITGKIPIISYIRPFGCHVTILNTIDHLGKFEEKSDEGFLVGYSLNSKAFRVYNLETKRVEENLHIIFLENKPNVAGKGPNWLFDLDYLTDSMNYQHVTAENKVNKTAGLKEANHSAGTQDNIDAGNSEMEAEPAQEYFVLLLWSSYTSTVKSSEAKNGDEKPNGDTGPKTNEEPKDQEDQAFLEELERLKRQEKEANDAAEAFRKEFAQCTKDLLLQAGAARATSTNTVNTVSTPISTASPSNVFSAGGPDLNNNDQDDSQIPALEDIYDNPSDEIFTNTSYDDEGAVADFTNLETTMNVSPIPTSRIHSIHPTTQILGNPTSAVQTRSKVHKSSGAHAFVSYIQKQRRNNHKDFQHCLFAYFLSQIEPKKISQALKDKSWVNAMQKELLQFKIQKVWILVDLPFGKRAIGTKWVYRNKKDERGVVVRNKARLVAQGYRQEEGIEYDEVFAPVARIEAIRIFLAFASYMGFIVSQMDVKSAFLYGTIDEEVYLLELDDIIFGSTKKSWCDDFEALIKSRFQISSMGELTFFLGLQVKQKEDGIFISQDKYVVEILKKFDFVSRGDCQPLYCDTKAIDQGWKIIVLVLEFQVQLPKNLTLLACEEDLLESLRGCSYFLAGGLFRVVQRQESNIMATSTTEEELCCCCQLLWASIVDSESNMEQVEGSAQPNEPQPTPSPTQPSIGDQPFVTESSYRPDTTQVPRDSLEGTNWEVNWDQSVQRLSIKKRLGKKEFVSKPWRKNAKSKPSLDAFDVLDLDSWCGLNGNRGRGSTVSTARPEVDTARPNIDTAKPEVHTAYAPVNTAGTKSNGKKERTKTIFKERAKFLAETIAAQRKFRAAQRAAKIRSSGDDTSKKEEGSQEPDNTKIESMNKEDAGERVLDVSKKRKGGQCLMQIQKNSGRIKKDRILRAGISMRIVRLMKLEAMIEERRIFKCWFHHHTTNGQQFTMSNRHQELASPKQTASALAIPEQTATGKEASNPFMADSLPKLQGQLDGVAEFANDLVMMDKD
ncbi:putative ribonuclease H-like domain-containing protein [Tanacetum coccineum]